MSETLIPEIVAIIPTRRAFDYAGLAIRSFLEQTPASFALIVDDAAPGLDHGVAPPVVSELLDAYRDRTAWIAFAHHGGPIRSWNYGLTFCRDHLWAQPRYVCCANSD